ncbi:MAG: zf-HC2 domain-containing protein [Kineosporiaceae bacterium]|jgi:anti-sigma factor (TIGR02949 family)
MTRTPRTSLFTRIAMRLMGRGDEASCAEVADHLQAYLDGHTDPEQMQRIAKHLEHCRHCGLEHRTYTEIKSALTRQSEPVDADAVRRLTDFGQALLHGEDRPVPPPADDR